MTIKTKVKQDDNGLYGYTLVLWDDTKPEHLINIRNEEDIINLVVALNEIKIRLEIQEGQP